MSITIYNDDCIAAMRGMDAGSVHCCVTSPPYWGLRDYGTGEWVGGDEDCEHVQPASDRTDNREKVPYKDVCGLCGAKMEDRQLGLESTPDEFVAKMVEVFREVWRVLRDDGTLWLNLGSSYFGGQSAGSHDSGDKALPDCPGGGCQLIHLCDECLGARLSRTVGIDTRRVLVSEPCDGVPILVRTESRVLCFGSSGSVDRLPNELSNLATHDRKQVGDLVLLRFGVSLESTTLESLRPPPGECFHCGNCAACLCVLGSSSRESLACARMISSPSSPRSVSYDAAGYSGRVENIADRLTTDGASACHNRGTASCFSSYPSLAMPRLKVKDLVPIPWLVAMALQNDGWYLRSDIIWAKKNPMPESCTDRPTKSHEYVFLLTKRARYFYDADAVRESHSTTSGWYKEREAGHGRPMGYDKSRNDCNRIGTNSVGRNRRTVWTIPTEPFPGAHFATFPRALVVPCLKAGTSERGCCRDCGTPWRRVVERHRTQTQSMPKVPLQDPSGKIYENPGRFVTESRTTGWTPGCKCERQWDAGIEQWVNGPRHTVPCIAFDPFCGSGTVGVVAKQLGLDFVGIELNAEYAEMARRRIANPEPEPVAAEVPGQMELYE